MKIDLKLRAKSLYPYPIPGPMSSPREFSKIDNTNSSRTVDGVAKIIGNTPCILTEKIHGANFSFYVSSADEADIIPCRRRGALARDENFYNFQDPYNRYLPAVKTLVKMIKEEIPGVNQIQVFGELYGGMYGDLESTPGTPRVKPVQLGVYYCPHIDFIGFAIWVSEATRDYYLDFNICERLAKAVGLPFVEPLHRGLFNELIKIDPVFPTTIPRRCHGLEPIPNNFAEGYVLLPTTEKVDTRGHRVALKLKHPKFDDFKDARPPSTPKETKSSHPWDRYITDGRLASVKSKMTDSERSRSGLVIKYYADDIMEAFEEEHPEPLSKTNRHDYRREIVCLLKSMKIS